MRHVSTFFMAVALVGSATVAAQDKKPPESLIIPNKGGDVVFTHAAHINREKEDCATCHPKLWPQSAAAGMKNSDGCRTCHQADGKAFDTKGNCAKCHPGGAKTG